MNVVSESEFAERLRLSVSSVRGVVRSVIGPGRSGAVAAVYASHELGVPWLPQGAPIPPKLRPTLVIDTARASGATLRKMARRIGDDAIVLAVYEEPPRVAFWYEAKVRTP